MAFFFCFANISLFFRYGNEIAIIDPVYIEDKEVYDGEVVKVDGKNYVKFITNHFSTYVLASEAIENPQTLDEISNSILITCVSLLGLFGSVCFLIKKSKVKTSI